MAKYFKQVETPATGHEYIDGIPEADIAFDTVAGHSHDGANSKSVGGGGSGDMLKSTYDPNEDGVIALAQLDTGISQFKQADHDALANPHHPESHTLASHSAKAHTDLTSVTADQHHAQAHTHAGGGADVKSGAVSVADNGSQVVTFTTAFIGTPHVVVSFADNQGGVDILYVTSVSTTGFTVGCIKGHGGGNHTWAVNWIATDIGNP